MKTRRGGLLAAGDGVRRDNDGTPPEASWSVRPLRRYDAPYEIYLARGAQPGHDLEDWLQAEKELHEEIRRAEAPGGRS